MKNDKIVIIGAGLSGTLLAITMAQRGYRVALYERREDMRKVSMSAGRSINLALSPRGMLGLREAALFSKVTVAVREKPLIPFPEVASTLHYLTRLKVFPISKCISIIPVHMLFWKRELRILSMKKRDLPSK